MNRVWLLVVAVLILGSIFKSAFINSYVWVVIDLLVLLVCYFLLKSQPFINLRYSMIFLGGLTAVNILMDLNIIGSLLGNLICLVLVLWLFFGKRFSVGGRRRYPQIRRKFHK